MVCSKWGEMEIPLGFCLRSNVLTADLMIPETDRAKMFAQVKGKNLLLTFL